MGENSAKSLKAISDKSASYNKDGPGESGLELGFTAEISETKEIIFKEMTAPNGYKPDDGNWNSRSFPMNAWYYEYLDANGNFNALFGVGHTHTPGYLRNQVPNNAPAKELAGSAESYAVPPGSPKIGKMNGTVDYSTPKSFNGAMFIGTLYGITVYGKSQPFTPTNHNKY